MRKGKIHIFLLLPFWVYYILFFFIPLGILLTYSFWLTTARGLVPTFTLENYWAIFSKKLYLIIILRSIRIAFIAAIICVVVSYPVAYSLTFKYKKMQDFVLYLILISLFSSYLVRIYAWKTILGRQGLINQILQYIGLTKEPLSFLLYSPTAVIITLVFIFVPFTILPIFSSLQNVKPELIEAAKDLGANNFEAFYKVTLPLSMSGVVTGFIFSFILSAGDYVTPQLVGGTTGMMIGKIIADQFGMRYNWPFGSALSYFTLFLLALLVYCLIWILKILKLRR
ncbi:spermidine/putrescine ABC transporter [Candidatus Aerophobetes bacterium Ae_b3b]|nr:ABC transporter permease [Candidatus Aerophobetes bacterium]TKJ46218.1 MAG: spermidine/putrescine ABC transporter [Candidatus Aerophobetes bacterium Ae_b3b]